MTRRRAVVAPLVLVAAVGLVVAGVGECHGRLPLLLTGSHPTVP